MRKRPATAKAAKAKTQARAQTKKRAPPATDAAEAPKRQNTVVGCFKDFLTTAIMAMVSRLSEEQHVTAQATLEQGVKVVSLCSGSELQEVVGQKICSAMGMPTSCYSTAAACEVC